MDLSDIIQPANTPAPVPAEKRQIFYIALLLGAIVIMLIATVLVSRQTQKPRTTTDAYDPKTLSLTHLTPIPAGNAFEQPILQPQSNLSLYAIGGHISAIVDASDKRGKIIYLQTREGKIVREGMYADKNTMVTLIVTENGKKVTRSGSLKELRTGDDVVASYNMNVQTQQGFLSGVRVTR